MKREKKKTRNKYLRIAGARESFYSRFAHAYRHRIAYATFLLDTRKLVERRKEKKQQPKIRVAA